MHKFIKLSDENIQTANDLYKIYHPDSISEETEPHRNFEMVEQPHRNEIIQRKPMSAQEAFLSEFKNKFGKKVNGTTKETQIQPSASLPSSLREKIEQKSGLPMDDVQIQYHSAKPAEIGALAYTKGTDIFIGPGQEKYLEHELWHVVQQKKGMVQANCSLAGQDANIDPGLEMEADTGYLSSRPESTTRNMVIQPKLMVSFSEFLAGRLEKGASDSDSDSDSDIDAYKSYFQKFIVPEIKLLEQIRYDLKGNSLTILYEEYHNLLRKKKGTRQPSKELSDAITYYDNKIKRLYQDPSDTLEQEPDSQNQTPSLPKQAFDLLKQASNIYKILQSNNIPDIGTLNDLSEEIIRLENEAEDFYEQGYLDAENKTLYPPSEMNSENVKENVKKFFDSNHMTMADKEDSKPAVDIPKIKFSDFRREMNAMPGLHRLIKDLHKNWSHGKVMDRRTQLQVQRKVDTSDHPGAMRCIHTDSNPGNRFPMNTNASTLPNNALEYHMYATQNAIYTTKEKEQLKEPSQIDERIRRNKKFLLEYSGIPFGGEPKPHNNKIVFDYLNGRVYVTFDHYKNMIEVDIES